MSAIKAEPIENVSMDGGRIKCPHGEIRDRRKGKMGSHVCRKKSSIRGYTKHLSPNHNRYGYARSKVCPRGSRKDTRKGRYGHCRRNDSALSPRRKYNKYSRAMEDRRLFRANPFASGGETADK
jgi:hypothetical protein